MSPSVPRSTGSRHAKPKPLSPMKSPSKGRHSGPRRRISPRRPRHRGIPFTVYFYLAAEILWIFGLAVVGIALIYITVIGFQLVRDGIRLDFVWTHVLRTIAYPLFFSIPLAFLFGITLGTGRMANDQELSALRAHGISHLQLCLPILILGLGLGALTFYLTGWVLPAVHYEQANLRKTILDQLSHLGSGTNRTILLPGDVSLWVKRYEGPHLRGIYLDIRKDDQSRILPKIGALAGEAIRQRLAGQLAGKVTVVAREADIEVAPDKSRVILWLQGVEIQIPEVVSSSRGMDVFHQMYTIEKLPLPLAFARRGESAKDLANPELLRRITSLKAETTTIEEKLQPASSPEALFSILPAIAAGEEQEADLLAGGPALALKAVGRQLSSLRKRIARAESELHSRITFSLACLTFPLVAFPLVVLLERYGRLTHFFLGNLTVVTIFFPLVMAGHLAADREWPAALAMAFPNVALLASGIPLVRAMFSR